MRTTLDLDEDVLQAVKEFAKREGKTAGKVASELLRRAITTPMHAPTAVRETPSVFGVRPFPSNGRIVTNEMINKLREDDIY